MSFQPPSRCWDRVTRTRRGIRAYFSSSATISRQRRCNSRYSIAVTDIEIGRRSRSGRVGNGVAVVVASHCDSRKGECPRRVLGDVARRFGLGGGDNRAIDGHCPVMLLGITVPSHGLDHLWSKCFMLLIRATTPLRKLSYRLIM